MNQNLPAQISREVQNAVPDKKGVATCLGFGPRFPHSTSQAHEGGPNTGIFQAACGDFDVLAERRRRALRSRLPADLRTGLSKLPSSIREAIN
jgi:transaldolase/glucose-6-phosphate isomerase